MNGRSLLVFLLLGLVAPGAALAQPDAAERDYLRRKWREDLSDPATGLDGATLKTNLAECVKVWRRQEGWPIVKALIFSNLCERTAIDVSEHDWFPTFALWTRHTDKLNPVLPLMAARRNEIVAKYVPKECRQRWPNWCSYADFDHSAPNWDEIIPLGFPGMKTRLLANWKETDYYKARLIAIDGVLRLMDRLVEKGCKVSEFQCCKGERLRGCVESLRRLRAGAPRTALDVLNFIYLYWSLCEKFDGIQVRTLGNLDRILAPYYAADLAAGRTNEAEFRDQLRHFWWQWGSIDNYWGSPSTSAERRRTERPSSPTSRASFWRSTTNSPSRRPSCTSRSAPPRRTGCGGRRSTWCGVSVPYPSSARSRIGG